MADYLIELRKLIGSRPILAPGIRAIVLDEAGRVLLQRRTDNNLWGLPAGSLELGETAEQALRREVFEETALKVLEFETMAVYSGPRQLLIYPHGDQVYCFSVAFVVRKWSGEPTADGEEGSEVRFFAMDALPEDLIDMHREALADFAAWDGQFFLGQ